jgi:hypothetical protein
VVERSGSAGGCSGAGERGEDGREGQGKEEDIRDRRMRCPGERCERITAEVHAGRWESDKRAAMGYSYANSGRQWRRPGFEVPQAAYVRSRNEKGPSTNQNSQSPHRNPTNHTRPASLRQVKRPTGLHCLCTARIRASGTMTMIRRGYGQARLDRAVVVLLPMDGCRRWVHMGQVQLQG